MILAHVDQKTAEKICWELAQIEGSKSFKETMMLLYRTMTQQLPPVRSKGRRI